MIPQILGIVTQIPALVGMVQSLIPGKGKGPFRKSAITGIIRVAVQAAEGISGKDLVNDEEFVAGIDMAIEGAVKAMNAVNRPAGKVVL